VDSRHVTNEQAKVISAWVTPAVDRLYRLRERMRARGFPPEDRLFQQVAAAYTALGNLNGMLGGYNDPCRRPLPLEDEGPPY
jgi:hypothetical protein